MRFDSIGDVDSVRFTRWNNYALAKNSGFDGCDSVDDAPQLAAAQEIYYLFS